MEITVKVSDLKKMVDDLVNDEIDFVDMCISEPFDLGDGTIYPLHINFNAYDGYGGGTDYENIEHVDVDVRYKLTDTTN